MIGFTWNPSIYKCECNKSCDFGEYLNYIIEIIEKDWLISRLNVVVKILKEMKWFIMQLCIIINRYAILVHYT